MANMQFYVQAMHSSDHGVRLVPADVWGCAAPKSSIIGAPLGAQLASRLPGELLKKGFAVVLLILAAGLIRG